jgi:hypothetical protein
MDRLEQFAVPIDQPRHLIAVCVQGQVIRLRILSSDLLLPDPQASGFVGHHGKRVGIETRRLEHPGRLRQSRRHRAAAPAGTAAACAIRRRTTLLRQHNRRRRDVQSETGRQELSSFHAHGITPQRLRFGGNILQDLEATLYHTTRRELAGAAFF